MVNSNLCSTGKGPKLNKTFTACLNNKVLLHTLQTKEQKFYCSVRANNKEPNFYFWSVPTLQITVDPR